jgi:hypothetical protein
VIERFTVPIYKVIDIDDKPTPSLNSSPIPPVPPFEVTIRSENFGDETFFVTPLSPGLSALKEAEKSGRLLDLMLTREATSKTIVDVVWTETGKSLIHR